MCSTDSRARCPRRCAPRSIGVELDLTSDAVIYLTATGREEARHGGCSTGRDVMAGPDDTLGVIRHRLAVFTRETAPLVDYYRGPNGILLELSN